MSRVDQSDTVRLHRSTAVLLLSIGAYSGCGSDETGFCSDARRALNDVRTPADGGEAVLSLRAAGTDELDERDAASWRVAVEGFANAVENYEQGGSFEGWSTYGVATVASRVCGSGFDSFYLMP